MPFVSITRLKVKSIFNLLSFVRANESSVKQLTSIKGFLAGKELIDKHLTFWTLTMWEDESSMRSFRNSTAHKKAMQKLPVWCNEASYFHWTQSELTLPGWNLASQRLFEEGKLSKVRYPSINQITNNFPPIRWRKIERNLNKQKIISFKNIV